MGELLYPGQLRFGSRGSLGAIAASAVVVCLWDPLRRCGGGCHVVPGAAASDASGHLLVQRLVEALYQSGSQRHYLEAQLFGGAAMSARARANTADRVVELLEQERILLCRQDTGGAYARRILFDLGSGSIQVTPIAPKGPVGS
jgi:chemotaxis receptor (MCP) glutamine deamidase CheD